MERFMAICSECDTVLDFDPDDADEGEVVVCDECGAEFEIVGTDPLELSKVDTDGYENEDSVIPDEEEE
jgi:alpha-aminoadipate/glutamate carrier protein LysW